MGGSLALNDIFCEMTPMLQLRWVLLKNGSMEIAANFLVLRGLSFAQKSEGNKEAALHQHNSAGTAGRKTQVVELTLTII